MKPFLRTTATGAALLLSLCVSGQPRHALPAPDNNCLSAQIGRYPQEKLHVTTDKDSYILGDTIWLRAHCADAATHRPVAASRYVYVELRDGRGALSRRIKLLSRDSVYSGYLPTQALERFGDYSLVAYTLYMRNQGADYFFKKPLSIWPYQEDRKTQRNSSARKVSDFDVSFFPEGGYLIDGHACCVAFKALGDDGGSVEVAGVLKNDRGEVLDTLRTLHGGLGSLRFTPHTGERYYVECTLTGGRTKRFALPVSDNRACVLQVLQTDETFTVQVRSGRPLPAGLRLLVHCRGNLCYFREWNSDLPSLIFERDKLPGGVLQVLLLDKAGNALSERLVFNRGAELAATGIEVEGALKQRTKVRLDIAATTPDGRPAAGDFSIAVTDRTAVPAPVSGSIYATMLLTSELRGYVETPNWYFEQESAERTEVLDALLLTQGWRRYDVPAVVRGEYAEPRYALEVGQEIAGRINKGGLWNRKKKLDRYEMRMIVPRWHYSRQVPVDNEGRFALNGFDFPDSTLYVLRPAAAKGLLPEAYVKVARDSFPEAGVLPRIPDEGQTKPYVARAQHYIEQRGQADMRNVLIDTVYVTHRTEEAKTIEQQKAIRSWNSNQIKESGVGTILDFVVRMPGIIMRGDWITYKGYAPAFMINGIMDETIDMLQNPMKNRIEDEDNLYTLPTCIYYPLEWVDRIDFIDSANTVLWGPGLAGGIIAITLKSAAELEQAVSDMPSIDVGLSSPLGYQTPAEFYAPAYPTEKARRSNVPDYRTTLYWNPAVEFDETGRATVEFYTSDAPADYDITIEGVTRTGKVVRATRVVADGAERAAQRGV